MAIEREFIEKGMRRSQIDEFLADELRRAGYGGMELARTPMGTEITLKAEKPGMVIGKGGKNIRQLTTDLEAKFELEDLQIDVQEVDEPDLNARIVADKLANALERGWYFRDAGQTTLRRIMDSGARGAQITFSGKVTGARARVEKFKAGYIKHCGEPAEEIVDFAVGTAVMKLGTIGVQVMIIPPDAELPDAFEVKLEADVEEEEEVEVEEADAEGIEEVVEEEAAKQEAGEEAEPEPVEAEPEATEEAEPEPEPGEAVDADEDLEEEPEPEEEEAEAEPEPEPETEAGETEEEEEEVPAEPGSVEDLEEMSYRDLQLLAKEVDVKANLKTEELIEGIAEAYDLEREGE